MTHRTPRRGSVLVMSCLCAALAVSISVVSTAGSAPPVSGDSYVYRLVNGYSNEVRGQLRYQVASVDAGSIAVAVAPDSPGVGPQRVEVYTREGNWLRRPLASHGQQLEYHFSAPYPAYVFPLETGK